MMVKTRRRVSALAQSSRSSTDLPTSQCVSETLSSHEYTHLATIHELIDQRWGLVHLHMRACVAAVRYE